MRLTRWSLCVCLLAAAACGSDDDDNSSRDAGFAAPNPDATTNNTADASGVDMDANNQDPPDIGMNNPPADGGMMMMPPDSGVPPQGCANCGPDEFCNAQDMCEQCSCGNRVCGMDQCGRSCGMCQPDESCTPAGACVSCDDNCGANTCGFTECGTPCGTCTGGQVCVGGSCQAFNPRGLTHSNATAAPANLARPAGGGTYMDPVFGTMVTRVTERTEETYMVGGDTIMGGFEVPDYSQLQPFNADQRLMLFVRDDPSYRVRDLATMQVILDLDGFRFINPRWHPRRPNTIIHYGARNDEIFLEFTNARSGDTDVLAQLTGYRRICQPESNEEPSQNGEWIAGMALRSNETDQFGCSDAAGFHDMFAYNMEEGRFGARINIGQYIRQNCIGDEQVERPNYVSVSPLGNYLVVQWIRTGTDRCNGLETFDIETGAYVGRVTDHGNHGDMGAVIDPMNQPAGMREYFMTFEANPGNDRNDFESVVSYSWLPGPRNGRAAVNPLGNTKMRSGVPAHVSCQGPDGMCLVSTYDALGAGGFERFEEEIFIQRLDGRVHRLAHTRTNACGYRNQPHATWSRNGQYAAWGSDWNAGNSCDPPDDFIADQGRADGYMFEVFGP